MRKSQKQTFPIHFIFAVTMPGKYRADDLKKIINICRNKMDMFFDGDYALFYQENQRSEMKPLQGQNWKLLSSLVSSYVSMVNSTVCVIFGGSYSYAMDAESTVCTYRL